MARIASIRTTIEPPSADTAAPATSGIASQAQARALFDTAMAGAMTSPYSIGGAPSLTSALGTIGTGAPADLGHYENGQIPIHALAPVPGTGHNMSPQAAAALTHLLNDAARDGISITINDGYRPYDEQVRLADELGLYDEGGLAAQPGTSQHGWGRAADLELDDQAAEWMRQNAWKYGYAATVPREPWHWEYHPA